MPQIPEHIIDRVRDSVDIVDVISRYVNLKKSGRNYKGLCPFHTEKTPSFNVNPDRQIFHCFGCHVGGNVFTFLMKYEKISFTEAVRKLAEEAGIEIPRQRMRTQLSEYDRMYRANQFAADFYQKLLQAHREQIFPYLKERGLSEETIRGFKLGFVPEAWDSLQKEIERKNMDMVLFRKLGLILQSEKDPSRLYDRFRNRLMFPIHNLSGKIVAFGGRTMSDDPEIPKYINSPESPIYKKSEILYGLFYAKEWIRQERYAIFVEGYMDFLQLFQNGIKNVVATSGTALTEEHARLVRRYTQDVVLCYDADTAGINAALRGGQVLFQNNLNVRVLILPEGEDPDSFVRSKGASQFYALMKQARDYFRFKMDYLNAHMDADDVNQRTRVVNELLDTLVPHPDPLKQNFYVNQLAEAFGIQETTLLNEIKKRQKQLARREKMRLEHQQVSQRVLESRISGLTGAWSAERDLIILLYIYFDKMKSFIFDALEPEDFLNEGFRKMFVYMRDNQSGDIETVFQEALATEADEITVSQITEHLFNEIADPERYLNDCIRKIKVARHQARINELRQQLKELPPDNPQQMEILREISHLSRQISSIQKILSP